MLWGIPEGKPKRLSFKKKVDISVNNNGTGLLLLVVGINIFMFILSLFEPTLLSRLWLSPEDTGLVRAYMFNFMHAGWLHIGMNMLMVVVFHQHIRRTHRFNKWLMPFLYFGMPLMVGLLSIPFIQGPTVGYSGVIMGLLAFGILNKIPRHRGLMIELIIIHVILLGMVLFDYNHNISILVHGIGAFCGVIVHYSMRLYSKFNTTQYLKKRRGSNTRTSTWREQHGKL